jgi:RNA polymerase sigma-70 factor (ECF subfamily)
MPDHANALSHSLTPVAADFEREFERLVIESSTLAFRVAYGVLHHREDAEDVAQEALLKAYRSFSRLRRHASFQPWLVRATWRLALDRQRANRRRALRDGEYVRDLDGTGTTEDPVLHQQIWRAMNALPEKLRLAMILAGIHGHDMRTIAHLLGVPEGTVKSRLSQARQRIREILK